MVREAVAAGDVVIACAYPGYVPETVMAQLPDGFASRSFVARFEGGKLIDFVVGMPEDVVSRLLPPREAAIIQAP